MEKKLKTLARRLGVEIEYHEELSSTNDRCSALRADMMQVVIAEKQTSGRGQRGNSWSSSQGQNLTFSIAVHPTFLTADKQFYISKIAALALTDALTCKGIVPQIKWSNDIYIDDQKVAGILIENDLSGAVISKSVIGIGLNVNQTEFPESIPNPCSLASKTGEEFDRVEMLELVLKRFQVRYKMLEQGGCAEIDTDYSDLLYRFGTVHRYRDMLRDEEFEGAICDVLAAGDLRIMDTQGEVRRFLFKEVEFIIP